MLAGTKYYQHHSMNIVVGYVCNSMIDVTVNRYQYFQLNEHLQRGGKFVFQYFRYFCVFLSNLIELYYLFNSQKTLHTYLYMNFHYYLFRMLLLIS